VNRYIVTTSVVLIIITILLSVTACASPGAKPPHQEKILRIGNIQPLTALGGVISQGGNAALQVYVDEINRDGGLKVGDDYYKVEIYFADGPIMPPSADVAAARSLVYEKGVDAIVGYYGLANPSIASITTPEKVIFVQSTLNMGTYDAEKHIYSVFGYPNLEAMGSQAVLVMKSFPEAKVLCWMSAEGGNQTLESNYAGWDAEFEDKFGFKSVHVSYPVGTMDFVPYLTKVAELNTDVIFTSFSTVTVGLIAKQAHQMGYKFVIAQGGPVLDVQQLKALAGGTEAIQNIIGDYSYPWALKQTKVSQKYLDLTDTITTEYRARFNKEPSAGAFSTNCNMLSQYFEAVQQAGTIDPDAVMNVFRGGTLDSFVGTYKFSGKKHYGADVVFGYPCCMSIIKGEEQVYLGENPLTDADTPAVDNLD